MLLVFDNVNPSLDTSLCFNVVESSKRIRKDSLRLSCQLSLLVQVTWFLLS